MASAQQRIEHGSDSVVILCYPCFLSKTHVQPTAYCVNCKQYLCSDCVNHHRKVVLTMKHTLLQDSQMPLDMSLPVVQDMCSEVCRKHRGKILEHFCEDDEEFCCSLCVIKDHRLCQNIVYIPEEAEKLLDGDEFKSYTGMMREIHTNIQDGKGEILTDRDAIGRLKSRALAKIQKVRERINDVLNKAESDINDKVKLQDKNNTDKMDELSAQLSKMENNLDVLSSETDRLQRGLETCQLYVNMKRNKAYLTTMMEDLEKLKDTNRITRYFLEPDQTLLELTKSVKRFGQIVIRDYPSTIRASFASKLNVKRANETHNWITSMVKLPNNKLVIADRHNHCLKVVDISTNTIECTQTLQAAPWCIASVDEHDILVTLPDLNQILLVSFNGHFEVKRSIDVGGKCYGVAYCDEKMIVSFTDKPKVQNIGLTGKIIRTIQSDKKLGIQFDCPRHVLLSKDKDLIYISDIHTKLVTVLTVDGDLWSVGKESLPNRPAGMCFDEDENVFLCGNWSDNIFFLSSDCTKGQLILDSNDVRFPESILYCRQEQRLYVGMWGNDVIKVFQVERGD